MLSGDRPTGRRRKDVDPVPHSPKRLPGSGPRLWNGRIADPVVGGFVLVVAAVLVLAIRVVGVWPGPRLPAVAIDAAAIVITTAFAVLLGIRSGGRPVLAGNLALVAGAVAVVVDWPVLTAGMAVATGVLAATSAVMLTMPAARFRRAVGETVVAILIAGVGALGVAGYRINAPVPFDIWRLEYAILAISAVAMFAMVFSLGAGFHGIGRRGYAVAGGAVVLVALAVIYSEAMAAWGSDALMAPVRVARQWLTDTVGAVPNPLVALLGIPALVWGTFTRARRRQGWWVCAFGVVATAPTTIRFLNEEAQITAVFLGSLYSVLIGLLVGYIAIRGEQFFTGSRGRRARRAEESVALRLEPDRFAALH